MIFTDVPGQVAKQLLDLAKRFGASNEETLIVDLGLTQEELAQLVGWSRETVNKVLSDFTQRGWIRQKGKRRRFSSPRLTNLRIAPERD